MFPFRNLLVSVALTAIFAGCSSIASTGAKTIAEVEVIDVNAVLGSAPSLPYQVWVNYSDGTSEYRQARWSNSGTATETIQASKESSVNQIGKSYEIKGFITGDNTTENGYPIVAKVTIVSEAQGIPSNVPVAEPLPLGKVRITGDNRLASNRDLDVNAILQWPVKQQLYNYRDSYGLSTEGYPESDGWDSPTTKLKGHGSGHYMSALAFAYAGTGDPQIKGELISRIRIMVDELRACQELTFVWDEKLGRYREARDYAPEKELAKMGGTWKDFDNYKKDYRNYGYGYINAIPAAHCALIEKYAPYNNEQGVWAPYYSIHKQLAGLIDIADNVNDKEIADKAFLIAKDMGLWVWNRMHYRTYVQEEGTQAERRAKPGNRYEMWNMYIAGEVGGMQESLSRLSAMATDPEEKAKLIEAANCFDSPAFYDPLSKNIDDIRTRHANQHIPMIVGALRSYRENKNPYYYNIASNFWNFIQGRYRYAMGGVGIGEMFRQPYSQMSTMTSASQTNRRTGEVYPLTNINETCCAYNLAKLSKDLNCFNPDDARYMDYYERLLFNQIVGSVHPHEYSVTYQYAVGLNSTKPFGSPDPQSSCCGGTGAENHVKYQEAAYFVNEDTMWIALYMPTVAQWDAKGVTIEQSCAWPAEKSVIKLTEGNAAFALKLRIPYWATDGFDIKLNGKSIAKSYKPSSYVEIPKREWSSKDKVEVIMPFTKHIDFGPDKMTTAISVVNGKQSVEPMWVGAFMYGPLVMASTGIEEWEDATFTISSNLKEVKLEGASAEEGTDGNVYSLSVNGRKFVPDYFANENATRYFRINVLGDPNAPFKMAVQDELSKVKSLRKANYTASSYAELDEAIAQAEKLAGRSRIAEEDATSVVERLETALKSLKSEGEIDNTALENVINYGDNLDNSAYTESSVEALKEALNNAKNVLSSSKSQLETDLQTFELQSAIDNLEDAAGVDKGELRDKMYVARARRDEQQRWYEMMVKVPEHSPWAPYGYARMIEQYDISNEVLNGNGRNYSQEEVNATLARLNEVINNMRPGNLPEVEDLAELNNLLEKAKAKSDSKAKEAVEYAEMVISYVTDGSGTKDMIERACKQLKSL